MSATGQARDARSPSHRRSPGVATSVSSSAPAWTSAGATAGWAPGRSPVRCGQRTPGDARSASLAGHRDACRPPVRPARRTTLLLVPGAGRLSSRREAPCSRARVRCHSHKTRGESGCRVEELPRFSSARRNRSGRRERRRSARPGRPVGRVARRKHDRTRPRRTWSLRSRPNATRDRTAARRTEGTRFRAPVEAPATRSAGLRPDPASMPGWRAACRTRSPRPSRTRGRSRPTPAGRGARSR